MNAQTARPGESRFVALKNSQETVLVFNLDSETNIFHKCLGANLPLMFIAFNKTVKLYTPEPRQVSNNHAHMQCHAPPPNTEFQTGRQNHETAPHRVKKARQIRGIPPETQLTTNMKHAA